MRCRDAGRALALMACALFAGQALHADPLARAETGQVAFSERLRLFAYGKLLETGRAPRGAVTAMKADMVRQGFYYDPGGRRLIAAAISAAPVLAWDDNINGGVAQDSVTIGGWVFEADPAFRAKSGPVLGVAADATMRLAWANGRYVEAAGETEAGWSPDHDIGRTDGSFRLCSANHLAGWTFLDACYLTAAAHRQLGTARIERGSLALSTLVDGRSAYHELRGEVAVTRYAFGPQTSATLSVGSVRDVLNTEVSLTLGAPVEGETALRHRISARARWLWQGRPMGLSAWQSVASGGQVLGQDRTDRSAGITLTVEPRRDLSLALGYSVTRSTVDFFDDRGISVSLNYEGLRW